MPCARGCCETQIEHYRSIRISSEATPSRQTSHFRSTTQRERNWEKDIPAAKRLLNDGVEIRQVDGAADMEAKAKTKVEIESGQVMSDKQRARYNAVVETNNEHNPSKQLPLAQ